MSASAQTGPGPLAGYRVVELADGDAAGFAARLLADLGADVIKINCPRVAADHRLDDAARLRSIALNAGKRSIALDLDNAVDQDIWQRLLRSADILVEDGVLGRGGARETAHTMVEATNPRLVTLSVTPFGLSGPRHDWLGSDLVLWALSGIMMSFGDPDRAPLAFGIPHACLLGGVHAAAGALIALHARDRDGLGDRVDLSIEDAMMRCHMPAPLIWAYDQRPMLRYGNRIAIGKSGSMRNIWPCRDGQVNFAIWGGRLGQLTKHCVDWMVSEGVAGALTEIDWLEWNPYSAPEEKVAEIDALFGAFFASRTMAELLEGGLAWRVAIAPINTINDVIGDPHLLDRDYWRYVDQPGFDRPLRFPGAPYRFSSATAGVRGPAPAIDADRASILAELSAMASPAGDLAPPTISGGALRDIKILDLALMFAGPWSTTYLADFGAQVVRVESARHTDPARDHPPFRDGISGMERSYMGLLTGNGKASIRIDLTTKQGLELVYELVRWADVVTESYSTGAAERLGVGYEKLREINPKIVMLSLNLEGRTGRRARTVGFGTDVQGRAGLVESTGWPDRGSAVPHNAYGDVVAPWFGAIGILAALANRRRTGNGVYIELSMYESLLSLAVVPLLVHSVTGAVPTRQGNRSAEAAPHGAYPCAGDDRWCAITGMTDDHWRRLRIAMGDPEWARDVVLDSLAGRKAWEDTLDEQIAVWTRSYQPEELAAMLQAAGVPAGAVRTMAEVMEHDPHVMERGVFQYRTKPGLGPVLHFAAPPRLSRSPRRIGTSPFAGENTDWVCREILGLTDERIQELYLLSVLN